MLRAVALPGPTPEVSCPSVEARSHLRVAQVTEFSGAFVPHSEQALRSTTCLARGRARERRVVAGRRLFAELSIELSAGRRGEAREARGGERAAAGQGVGAQRHACALSKSCQPVACVRPRHSRTGRLVQMPALMQPQAPTIGVALRTHGDSSFEVSVSLALSSCSSPADKGWVVEHWESGSWWSSTRSPVPASSAGGRAAQVTFVVTAAMATRLVVRAHAIGARSKSAWSQQQFLSAADLPAVGAELTVRRWDDEDPNSPALLLFKLTTRPRPPGAEQPPAAPAAAPAVEASPASAAEPLLVGGVGAALFAPPRHQHQQHREQLILEQQPGHAEPAVLAQRVDRSHRGARARRERQALGDLEGGAADAARLCGGRVVDAREEGREHAGERLGHAREPGGGAVLEVLAPHVQHAPPAHALWLRAAVELVVEAAAPRQVRAAEAAAAVAAVVPVPGQPELATRHVEPASAGGRGAGVATRPVLKRGRRLPRHAAPHPVVHHEQVVLTAVQRGVAHNHRAVHQPRRGGARHLAHRHPQARDR
eukprot:gene11473-biopygen7266